MVSIKDCLDKKQTIKGSNDILLSLPEYYISKACIPSVNTLFRFYNNDPLSLWLNLKFNSMGLIAVKLFGVQDSNSYFTNFASMTDIEIPYGVEAWILFSCNFA